jgi:TPR repeat protein
MVSTATVYVLMSAEERVTAPAVNTPLGGGPAQGTASPANIHGDATLELVRSASALIEKGNVEGARELLRRAAELGSGPAALELARTYDAAQATPMPPEAKETNSTLARVWYERARELGLPGAAPAQPPADR